MSLLKTFALKTRSALPRAQGGFYLLSRYISKKTYQWPELKESDIDEAFMRGGGPGGQAVAKTNNCVQIKHLPTGLVVKSHETRSQEQNRKIARQKLVYQLDIYYNKEDSFDAISRREYQLKKQRSEKKAKKRRDLKREFKNKGLDQE